MKKSPLWLGVMAALALQAPFHSAIAHTDDVRHTIEPRELMGKAELVFTGKVIDIQYKDAIDGTPHTFVTYELADVIAGRPDDRKITLRFLGGRQQKDEVIRYLSVSESPDFHVGETDVLFVRKNSTSFCPLVECSKGRFRIRDGVLTTEDGLAIIQTSEKSLQISSAVINPTTGEAIELGRAMSDPRPDPAEPHEKPVPANAVKAEQFIADLKELAKGFPAFQDGSVRFISANIKDDIRVPEFTPVTPRDIEFTSTRLPDASDFDRWEEEMVKKNDGNPVIR
jgi:hypothetical protein